MNSRLAVSRCDIDGDSEASRERSNSSSLQQMVEKHGCLRERRDEEGQQGQLAWCRQRRRNLRGVIRRTCLGCLRRRLRIYLEFQEGHNSQSAQQTSETSHSPVITFITSVITLNSHHHIYHIHSHYYYYYYYYYYYFYYYAVSLTCKASPGEATLMHGPNHQSSHFSHLLVITLISFNSHPITLITFTSHHIPHYPHSPVTTFTPFSSHQIVHIYQSSH